MSDNRICKYGPCRREFVIGRHTNKVYCSPLCRTKDSAKRWRANHLELARELGRNREKQHRTARSHSQRKYKYGLSQDQFEAMKKAQNNCCLLCGEPFGNETPFVDHNHTTGQVRGLLHNTCNIAIGVLKESPDLCRKAAVYLERFSL